MKIKKKNTDPISIQDRVYKFKTKYKQGFIRSEITKLLKSYPGIDMNKFNDALRGITGNIIDGNMVVYHCDIEKAIHCGIEKRKLKNYEWD